MRDPNRRDALRCAVGLGLLATSVAPAHAAPGAPRTFAEDVPWAHVRAAFALDPDRVHLAALLLAAHPAPVRDAIARHRAVLDADPTVLVEARMGPLDGAARVAAAEYLGATPEEVALTWSTTSGLALLYAGIAVRADQELVSTEDDYRVTREAVAMRAARTGATVRTIPLHGDTLDDLTEEALTARIVGAVGPRTRVLALTWVHSSTGLKLPLRAIADRLARLNEGRAPEDRVLLCVDGVHGFGVEDVSVADLGCDFFAAGTHKWIYGPRGTGILYGRTDAQAAVEPTVPTFTRGVGWGGLMSPGGYHAFEHRWAVADAFGFHRDLGRARVSARIHELAAHLKEGLLGVRHVRVVTPLASRLSAGIVCFEVDGQTSRQTIDALAARHIVGTTTPYVRSYARLTPAVYNSHADIEAVLRAVRGIA
jgi:isopenicillin-N epimerase